MRTATALTDAQERALRVMAGVGRAVGYRATNPAAGYVHRQTALALVDAGLLERETGAMGKDVFTLTDEGREVLDRLG